MSDINFAYQAHKGDNIKKRIKDNSGDIIVN